MPSTPIERIVLTGFMGSGKTTVGRRLAHHLGWSFADLDEAVSRHAGKSVPQIFAEDGEAAFRTAETAALAALLDQQHLILALGGGAPETPEVQHLLRTRHGTVVIHLQAPLDILYQRCQAQAANPTEIFRPLLGSFASAQARFERREPLYQALAHHTVDASTSPPDTLVSDIVRRLAL